MSAVQTQASLLARKRDVFAAIDVLDRDQEDGAIDEASYRAARHRYEIEAARILEEIDRLQQDGEEPGRVGSARRHRSRLLALILTALVVVGVAVMMVSAVKSRASAGVITGDAPTAPPAAGQVSRAVQAAQNAVTVHPKSAEAWVSLGTAFVNAAEPKRADQAYRTALKLDPTSPDGLSLHAMMVASGGHYKAALALVNEAEREHPAYARAWLLDGLFSARLPGHGSEAVRAWRHFLVLQPRGPVASQVRSWLLSAPKQR